MKECSMIETNTEEFQNATLAPTETIPTIEEVMTKIMQKIIKDQKPPKYMKIIQSTTEALKKGTKMM